jgi:two-component system phosphate regulon response regulator PhoB
VRHVVYHFASPRDFARALRESDQELLLPADEPIADGEWVLAMFEVGSPQASGSRSSAGRGAACRTTAAAARGVHRGVGAGRVLTFERRDWERLVHFAEAGGGKTRPAAPIRSRTLEESGERGAVPSAPPTQPSLPDFTAAGGPFGRAASAPLGAPSDPPAREPSHPSFGRLVASDAFAGGTGARILLVDDDRDIRDVVGAMLDAVGLIVAFATSAEEALAQVRSGSFDMLLLDWNLPGISGIELCRLIRRDPELSKLPVLFLTAHASSRDVVEAFASGADDYVVKPFRAPELGARIFGLLRRARMS